MGELLKNKNILIMGVRNKWSIAWGIAKAAYNEGAKLILTYQGEREKQGVEELSSSLGNASVYQCDITSDAQIDDLFSQIKADHGVLHGVVHAIAFAKSDDLKDSFVNTSRDGFALAMDVSAYSLVAVSRRAKELMTEGGSIVTLTYMGSVRVFPGYNVMGVVKAALEASVRYLSHDLGESDIRVNAISAGPVKTMSAKGVKDFGNILDVVKEKAPLKRGIDQDDLGDVAKFLLSDLSRSITGEIIYVDCGFNIMGI